MIVGNPGEAKRGPAPEMAAKRERDAELAAREGKAVMPEGKILDGEPVEAPANVESLVDKTEAEADASFFGEDSEKFKIDDAKDAASDAAAA